ncbi:aminoglycoside phosphotransferase family protein [Streptomyces sedi]|uniref:Aminoglycoside phosphotransferase family protein n=1 Tax=Streptomyces sedi TaxID=555059 RepID=A0A5C4VCL9_9ACTN|nr:aminoglycoside phosphotransferase family protein [Streptomyces sedi]TNM33621.1 aminoglycoside phosphotransferase family protein [Streptomyces sedi]
MDGTTGRRAVGAARGIADALGLAADEALVLQDSNKLTARLLPCDTLARIAPAGPGDAGAEARKLARWEIDLARRLVDAGCPVGAPDPRVAPEAHERDGFAVTFWTYHAPPVPPRALSPVEYAGALARLHAGMRALDVAAPRFTERVAYAGALVADRARTPELAEDDRQLLVDTLRDAGRAVAERGGAEQLLHGEPHPGNLLVTEGGPLFIDLETCCRGPVEFDLAHAPDGVGEEYPGVDLELLHACRSLVLAIITVWRWDRDDRLPDGRELGLAWLARLRETGWRGATTHVDG